MQKRDQSIPRLTAHDIRPAHLPACFRLQPTPFGKSDAEIHRACSVWSQLLDAPAFSGTVIELESGGASRIVAFGFKVFVSRDFVETELASPRPGLQIRLLESAAAGSPGILNEAQIRYGNTHHGLDSVTVVGFAYNTLVGEVYDLTTALVSAQFVEHHAGYWLRRIVMEVGNEQLREHTAETRVFRIIDFPSTDSSQGDPHASSACALATISQEEVSLVKAHPLIPLFLPKQPRLRLSRTDQAFLRIAVTGLTDEGISRALNMSVSGVKKRWLALFERLAGHQALFPEDGAPGRQTRGRQKRHLIVSYVRAHPEELAPFDW